MAKPNLNMLLNDKGKSLFMFIVLQHHFFSVFLFLLSMRLPKSAHCLPMEASSFRLLLGLTLIILPMTRLVVAQDETITIASEQFVVDPANYILDSTTVLPGSAGVSIDGQIVSADPANDLFVNGVQVLTGYPALSPTSGVASASNTAPSSFAMNVTDSGSSGYTVSGSQSSGIVSESMSASASGLGSFPTISSQDSNVYIPTSTAIGSFISESPISSSNSTGTSIGDSSVSSSGLTSSVNLNQNPDTDSAGPGSSSSSSLDVNTNSAGSTSSFVSDSNANTISASSAPQSTDAATTGASALDGMIPSGSTTLIQSNSNTGTLASAAQGTSLSSNGTASSFSSLTTQVLSSGSISITATTAPGWSNTISSMSVGFSSTPSSIPGSITSAPALVMPIGAVLPAGTAASAADISLGGLILGLSQEAQTLSAIVTNSASSSSYILKIEAVESKWTSFFKQIGGGDNPPSYDTVCTGCGLTGLLKLAGCITSGLDKIKAGIEGIDIDSPEAALTEIEGVIANVAEMTQEEEKEEEEEEEEEGEEDEDDDDDEQSTRNQSPASNTQQSSNTPVNSVSSTTLGSSTISSVSSKVVSSSAVSSGVTTIPPCDTNIPQALPAGYSIDNGASEVVLGFVGDILLSALGGGVSGFTTSSFVNSTSAMILNSETSSSSVMIPSMTAVPNIMSYADSPQGTTSSAATSGAPVQIPGQGGLSPCAEYLSNEQGYAPGTENYCYCDGINAPLLVSTISGTISSDCSYTTMPKSDWTPTVTAGYTSSVPPSSTPPPTTTMAPLGYQCTMMWVLTLFKANQTTS